MWNVSNTFDKSYKAFPHLSFWYPISAQQSSRARVGYQVRVLGASGWLLFPRYAVVWKKTSTAISDSTDCIDSIDFASQIFPAKYTQIVDMFRFTLSGSLEDLPGWTWTKTN